MNIHNALMLLRAAREKPDEKAAYAVLFGSVDNEHGPTRAALLRSVALELELTASHLRRVLEESQWGVLADEIAATTAEVRRVFNLED